MAQTQENNLTAAIIRAISAPSLFPSLKKLRDAESSFIRGVNRKAPVAVTPVFVISQLVREAKDYRRLLLDEKKSPAAIMWVMTLGREVTEVTERGLPLLFQNRSDGRKLNFLDGVEERSGKTGTCWHG